MSFLDKFFKKHIETSDVKEEEHSFDLPMIDESFKQLKAASISMGKQAIQTTKSLKDQLELFERRFTVITDSVDDVIIIKTVNCQWLSVNLFACDLLKLDRDFCIGKTNTQLMEKYPKLAPILKKLDMAEKEAWKKKVTTKFRVSIEEHQRTIYLDIAITPIDNGDNSIQELIIVGHNNTKLYESVNKNKAAGEMLNAMSTPICVLDSFRNIHFVNDQFQFEFDIDYKYAIKRKFCEILPNMCTDAIVRLFEENVSQEEIIDTNEYKIVVIPIVNCHVFNPLYYLLTFTKKKK